LLPRIRRRCSRLDGLESDLGGNTPLAARDLWHREDEDTISVGRVGRGAIDRFRQRDLGVIRANGPLRHEQVAVVLMRSPLPAVDRDSVPGHTDGDILGSSPGIGAATMMRWSVWYTRSGRLWMCADMSASSKQPPVQRAKHSCDEYRHSRARDDSIDP
jgi:hypothetical protein